MPKYAKAQMLGTYMGTVNVKGYKYPLPPVLLRVRILDTYYESGKPEQRFFGLRIGRTLYVTPFSDFSMLYKVQLSDTTCITFKKAERPMGISVREMSTFFPEPSLDPRLKPIHQLNAGRNLKNVHKKIKELLPTVAALENWSDILNSK